MLRVVWVRIGKRFEMILVYQSIMMIAVQLAVLEVCVRMRSVKYKIKRSFTGPLPFPSALNQGITLNALCVVLCWGCRLGLVLLLGME